MKLDLTKLAQVVKDSDEWGYEHNPHSNPQRYGLELVDDIEWENQSYQFDMTAVWKDKEGRLWSADSSGCSCPTPFEEVTELDRLLNTDNLMTRYRSMTTERGEYANGHVDPGEWKTFIGNVEAALADLKEQS